MSIWLLFESRGDNKAVVTSAHKSEESAKRRQKSLINRYSTYIKEYELID